MKLNGKVYIKWNTVSDILEDIIIYMETGNYLIVSQDLEDIENDDIDGITRDLAQFQDMYNAYFKKESYISYCRIIEIAEENMYDPTKYSVGLYNLGAYGVKRRSSSEARNRFIFNECIYKFIRSIKKIKN